MRYSSRLRGLEVAEAGVGRNLCRKMCRSIGAQELEMMSNQHAAAEVGNIYC